MIVAENGKEWPGMAGNGKEWQGMAGNGKEWPGMPENGRIAFSPLVFVISS